MDYSFIAIMAVVVMVCIGLVFGFILASADKKFAMEENPLIGEVKEALPQGQCGACGFAGLSLIHISEPTRQEASRMPSSA